MAAPTVAHSVFPVRRSLEFVTFIDWPPLPGQLPAYTHFCEHLSGAFEWAAFTDIDEFIHPLEGLSIKEVLPRYRHCSGVLVEWLTFGPRAIRAVRRGWYSRITTFAFLMTVLDAGW